MVNILPGLLNQVAVYWPPGDITQTGRRDYSAVTAVEVPCHWTNELNPIISNAGDKPKSTSRVVTSYAVEEYGVLWLSSASPNDPAGTALAEKPANVPTQQLIEHVERHFSVSADETLYKAYI